MFEEMRQDHRKNYSIPATGTNFLNDVSSWCNNIKAEVYQAISPFDGDIIGINANKIPEMVDAIEAYIQRINSHLDGIMTNTSTENAMKGEYALAVKEYVSAACDLCYKLTSHLRYFEDKLVEVHKYYTEKDESMKSTIGTVANDMNRWEEYKKQY